MQRRTLIRAGDLAAFRRVLSSRALAGPLLSARRRVVLVPTRAAAELLRQTLETAAIRNAGDALILPDLVTREEWLDRLRAAFPDAPPLLSRLARERLLAHAAHAAAARRSVGGSPFELRPGLIAAMLDLYDELKRRQQTVRRFTRALFAELDTVKGTDRGSEGLIHQTTFLGLAFLGYERRVDASGSWDEHLLRRELLTRQPRLPFDDVIVAVADHPADPKGLWPADFDLLGRLTAVATIDVVVTDELHDAGFRERIERELPEIAEERHVREGTRPVIERPAGGQSICWISRDREAEMRDVARLIRARARPGASGPELREPTAIIFRRPLPYLYLAQQVLADAHVPYQAFDALPLAAEPYAAVVDLVMTAARTGGTREAIVALLRSSLLGFVEAGAPVGHGEASALNAALTERRATGEADTYPAVVDEYFDDAETRRKDRHAPARRAARVAAKIRDELSPYRAGPTADRIRAVTSFLRRHERLPAAEAPGRERYLRARAAILGTLDALAAACDTADDPAEDPTAWIRHAIEARTFAPRRGAGGVHLVDALAAQFGEFDHVHLVGLVETDWPERPGRSVFYTSGLLEPLGWSARQAHAAAELAAFRDLLDLARRTTTLHAFNLDGDAIVARSPVVELASSLPARDAAAADERLVFADEVLTSGAAVEGLDPVASVWLERRRLRPGPADRTYRGHVDPRAAQVYRVNGVERYAICPFKYFAESVLRLPEEREESEGLTPLERGNLLHRLLEQFYRDWQGTGAKAITRANLGDAVALFERLARAALSRLPAGDRALEEARLLGSLVTPGLARRVFDLELSTGESISERLIEAALDGTYVFPQMSGLKSRAIGIKAKADRVDVFADGSLRVIDYKLGRPPDRDSTLQVWVYAHAAQAQLSARDGRPHPIRDARYLAFGERENRSREANAAEVVAGRVSAFADAVEGIEAGRFPARPVDVVKCGYCGFAGMCRKEYWSEADESAELV
jgi:RecB family exonuclease